jgi:ABC-type bacteriocin/lantibiotic exporter with double-glycine peptidase domain
MIPFIPQKNHDGCAIAVLTMVSNYFGIDIKYHQVEAKFKQKKLTFKDLINYFEDQGIKSSAYFVSDKNLEFLNSFPIILHYQNHYVIVYQRKNNTFLIADPASWGLKYIKITRITKRWSGNLLDISNNQIAPIPTIEKHLPYPFRLLILNILIVLIMWLIWG